MNSGELNQLPPEAFLEPERFKTFWDNDEIKAQESYLEGRIISEQSRRVGISAFGTWFAEKKDGSLVTSYQKIGYHAYTVDLLKGLLDGGAEVVVYRLNNSQAVVIKKGIS